MLPLSLFFHLGFTPNKLLRAKGPVPHRLGLVSHQILAVQVRGAPAGRLLPLLQGAPAAWPLPIGRGAPSGLVAHGGAVGLEELGGLGGRVAEAGGRSQPLPGLQQGGGLQKGGVNWLGGRITG